MAPRALIIFFVFTAFMIAAMSIFAQTPPDNRILPKPDDPDSLPKNVKEMLVKMKIEQEKKDYDQMISRGDDALKISEQIERSFSAASQLNSKDRENLVELEKLVKKVRSDLGGGDDEGEPASTDEVLPEKPLSIKEGVKTLQSQTLKMVEELKKTTRFSISAAAIQSSNAVLKVIRFLRGNN